MNVLIEFFPPNSSALFITFHTICTDGTYFSPRILTPTHVLYSAVTQPFLGYVRT